MTATATAPHQAAEGEPPPRRYRVVTFCAVWDEHRGRYVTGVGRLTRAQAEELAGALEDCSTHHV